MIRLAGQRDIHWDVLWAVHSLCVSWQLDVAFWHVFFFFSYKSQESSNTKNWSKLESGIFVSFSAMLTAEFCFAVLFELKFSICLTTGLGGEGCTKQVFAMGKYTNV